MNDVVAIAKALGDLSRLRVLVCLEGTMLCLCQLTEILGLASSTLSKHLSILDSAGLVVWQQEGRWRYYRWAQDGASIRVLEALEWVRRHALETDMAKVDSEKRAIVMQTSEVPCPRESKARVMFLCTGNSCRSQMAEALLRACAGDRFEIYSAGLDPKPIADLTYAVMDEIGIDIRAHQPKGLKDYLGRVHFGYLITVCSNAESRCPIFPGVSYRLYWPLDDPAKASGSRQQRLQAFRKTRDELSGRILSWLAELGIQPAIALHTASADAEPQRQGAR